MINQLTEMNNLKQTTINYEKNKINNVPVYNIDVKFLKKPK